VDPRGIRLGVQEMTRNGMGPQEMEAIAGLFHAALAQGKDVRSEVRVLRERFAGVQYGYSVADLA